MPYFKDVNIELVPCSLKTRTKNDSQTSEEQIHTVAAVPGLRAVYAKLSRNSGDDILGKQRSGAAARKQSCSYQNKS